MTRHCIPDEERPLDARDVVNDPYYCEKAVSRLERKRVVQNFNREQIRGWAEWLIREKIAREIIADGVSVKIEKFGVKTVYNDADDQKPVRFGVTASYTRTPFCGCSKYVTANTVEEAVADVMKSVDWVLRSITPYTKKERPPEGMRQEPIQYDLAL